MDERVIVKQKVNVDEFTHIVPSVRLKCMSESRSRGLAGLLSEEQALRQMVERFKTLQPPTLFGRRDLAALLATIITRQPAFHALVLYSVRDQDQRHLSGGRARAMNDWQFQAQCSDFGQHPGQAYISCPSSRSNSHAARGI